MQQNDRTIFYFLIGLSVVMLGMSFAAVPIYRLICQKTGFGGTPQIGLFNVPMPDEDHFIRVRFSATTHRDLPWRFKPKQYEVTAKIGEPTLVFFEAENKSKKDITGMAMYNVSPDKAGIYFGKIQCFCFEQQLLEGGKVMDMPVLFTVSPDILKDDLTKDLKVITLSYTFFEYKK
jgi:cytochrome c oxidase assembly protein subunit 11